MNRIELVNASVHFALFDPGSRSLRKRVIHAATGGKLARDVKGFTVVRALSDLTLSIAEGERVGLLGANGAGKTTLLGVLGGVYEPNAGSARICGSVGSLINITLGTDHESTGRENILLRAALLGIPRRQILAQIDEIIEFSGLGEFIDLPVRTYSTGMNLRLAFSVSTMLRPEILLMDEWLSVGDREFTVKAQKRMAEMRDASSVLVVATHSKDLLMKQCNRAIWLENGRIKMDGRPEEVADEYFGAKFRTRGSCLPRGTASQIGEYVCRRWANTRLASVDWEKIQGGAVSALIELLEQQGGFFRLPEPRNAAEQELQHCLVAAWKTISPDIGDTEVEKNLRRLEPANAGEILAELVVYQHAKRSSNFWIKALESASVSTEIEGPLRARLESRLAVLRKSLQDPRGAGNARLHAINPLSLEIASRSLNEDWDDTVPAPAMMIVMHQDRSGVLGESIVFRECSLTEAMTVVVNGRYFSANHDAAGWIRDLTKLHSAAGILPDTRAAFPPWYLDTPNDYLKFTQLIPSIILATELGDGSCRIFANLAEETTDQLKATATFFGRGIPDISKLEPAAGNPASLRHGSCLLVRATHRYIARLRAGAPPGRWRSPGCSGRKIYLAASGGKDDAVSSETELRARLAAAGFEIVIAGVTPFAQEIELLSEAQTIVAAPGPHLARMIFCSPECRFLELSGIGEPVSLYAQLAATCGIKSYQQLLLPASAASWPELTNLL